MVVTDALHGQPPERTGRSATSVVVNTTAAVWSAPSADPALNPNHPNHKSPAPSITRVRLWGRIGSLPNPMRRPSTRASASPEAPEQISTAVPRRSPPGRRGRPASRRPGVLAHVEDPVGDRRAIHHERPEGDEDDPGPEAGPVRDRSRDQRAGDHAEQTLEDGEQDERHLRGAVARGRHQLSQAGVLRRVAQQPAPRSSPNASE